jgi:hypothetical protein
MSKKSLDALGVAITNAGYTWTPEMRNAYEKGIRESEWVGLTDDEKHELNDALNLQGRFPIIEAIEAKLKEKNT